MTGAVFAVAAGVVLLSAPRGAQIRKALLPAR